MKRWILLAVVLCGCLADRTLSPALDYGSCSTLSGLVARDAPPVSARQDGPARVRWAYDNGSSALFDGAAAQCVETTITAPAVVQLDYGSCAIAVQPTLDADGVPDSAVQLARGKVTWYYSTGPEWQVWFLGGGGTCFVESRP